MSLSALATAAVAWLVRAFRSYRKRRESIHMVLGAVKDMGFATEQLEKFTEVLAKAEKTVGARTDAWRKIVNGAKDKRSVTLSVEDVKYLGEFKEIFDKYIKKPFKK
jgi:hypothetical protein